MSSARGSLPRWIWGLVGVAGAGVAVYALRGALTPIFFAFLIAYLLDPLVDRFEARGVPRALGISIVLVLTLGGFALVLLLVVPGVVHEVRAFAHELPGRADAVRRAAEPWLAERGVEIPHSFEELRTLVGLDAAPAERAGSGATPAGELASRAGSVLGTVGEWIWGRTSSAIAVIGTVLIVPVFAFYLLYDFDRMTAGIRDLVPWRYRELVVPIAREVDQVLGQFVRGQLLVMLILAVLYSLAYSLVGVRLAIPIGIVAGLLSFIPYVGGASALLLALLMCALSWQGWWQVGGVVIVYGVIQMLEGFVITPRIVGDKVGLPAVWVLVALMFGGELFGFLGVLLAVPAAAVAKIFVVRALAAYRESRAYAEGAPEVALLSDDLAPELAAPDALASEPEPASGAITLEGLAHDEPAADDVEHAVRDEASSEVDPDEDPACEDSAGEDSAGDDSAGEDSAGEGSAGEDSAGKDSEPAPRDPPPKTGE